MEFLDKLTTPGDVPVLTRAWEHNGEILGLDPAGNLLKLYRMTTCDPF